ncbi:unnamed protein product [Arabidopsis thaliana]|uniref:Uncharacterized protein n=1 Tax=Arabidopsis thaliana TaxID=3702 RepID=A0A654GAX5_ARATH|nr:unnamed protein product [Arabidopsis thaliana]
MMKCIWCVVYKISTLVKSGAQGVANHLQHEEKMLVSPDVVGSPSSRPTQTEVDRQFELDLQKGREKYKGATILKKNERKKWERKNRRNQSKSLVKEEEAELVKEEKEKEEQRTEKEEEEEEEEEETTETK